MDDLGRLRGRRVLVAGAGVSGRAVTGPLADLGAEVTVTDSRPESLARSAADGVATIPVEHLLADRGEIAEFALVVTSPGFRPDAPLLAAAAGAGVPIWGDIELTWRIDRAEIYGPARRWLVVTGTNGKTTTTSMLEAILVAAGIPAAACGNIGLPVIDALRTTPRVEVLAVELSSFQLFWAPSVRPDAGAVLNIAEDHLDWHGGMQGYIDAKARALTGRVAVVGLDDPEAARLGRASAAEVTVGFRLGEPEHGEFGIVAGALVDRAFADVEVLAPAAGITPPGEAGLLDALAAAALARAAGVAPEAVADGLAGHRVGPHRGAVVEEVDEVRYVDDSKATNPHAARSSLLAHSRIVWVAGGLLKGARVEELVIEIAPRLAGAVLIGEDAGVIAEALARHAPEVPVVRVETGDDAGVTPGEQTQVDRVVLPGSTPADAVMAVAVDRASRLAEAGTAVVLAPAAASLDMFDSYGHRGRSFAAAVAGLPGRSRGRAQTDPPGTP
ncbi:UDP-N-acetylmuramoylalanine--D-glutamate ligase [Rhodococcus triatomae]|uniref:UDP-N-acetylmuramoylalanine--D-glutamate ligase n=1 Tax=Rhodococcus triatomae TaxID=300028 RepID=A0A1G8D1J9_9NOCA|nr:UDP-N-acetylmuramoyl-L-alanine--D-glutamate ligase [Rhodococcus triatomae]SDH51717.1 UDP-N-acetylmuramoylalanine--D-glutamate ligase [Rhodococcus triatomae]